MRARPNASWALHICTNSRCSITDTIWAVLVIRTDGSLIKKIYIMARTRLLSASNEQWYPSTYVPHCPHSVRRQKLPRPRTLHHPPASSASPPTPVGIEDLSAKIGSASSSPGYTKFGLGRGARYAFIVVSYLVGLCIYSIEFQLPPSRLQHEFEACQDPHNERAEKVNFWKCVSPVPRNFASYQACHRSPRPISSWKCRRIPTR